MTATMTRRERVLTALSRRQPDRVPIDLGGTKNSTIHTLAYERLKRHLGISTSSEPRVVDRNGQGVEMEEAVLDLLDVDTRAVYQGGPDHPRAHEVDGHSYRDEWGVLWSKPAGGNWYNLAGRPLSGEITLADIANYPWPDPLDPGIVRPIVPQIEHLRRTTDCALLLYLTSPFVHKSQYLMGFQDWFLNIALDQRLIGALFDAVLELTMAQTDQILKVAGGLVDLVYFADDVADQNGPIISLEAYRKLIAPRHRAYVECIRARTPAAILYHSCGSLYPLMEDIISLGVDAVNPVQVSARDMGTNRLKKEFGDRITFWGAVDTQNVLPSGTVQDVREEVQRRISDLAPGGGYVLASVHNIQADVPPENICAMIDAARKYGAYEAAS